MADAHPLPPLHPSRAIPHSGRPGTALPRNPAFGSRPGLSVPVLAGIVMAHGALLALLVSMDLVPLPPAVATLMVRVLPPAVSPAPPEVTASRGGLISVGVGGSGGRVK